MIGTITTIFIRNTAGITRDEFGVLFCAGFPRFGARKKWPIPVAGVTEGVAGVAGLDDDGRLAGT